MVSSNLLTDGHLTDPATTLIGLDFDGTLAPIVDDPEQAFIHPRSFEALTQLAPRLAMLAIVTGRPVDQALTLGGFRAAAGLEELLICGQYGAERWDAGNDAVERPDRPESIDRLAERLPAVLADADVPQGRLEDKGLAIAIHTRGLDEGAFSRMVGPLRDLARELNLSFEPGKQVVEIRASKSTKGEVMRELIERVRPTHVIYAGDDLGDLSAFEAITELRDAGRIEATLVASASTEEDALTALADLVLDGPDAVADWLTTLSR